MLRFILALLVSAPVFAADSYVCIPDQTVGFNAADNWRGKLFKTAEDKYIMRQSKSSDREEYQKYAWLVFRLGGSRRAPYFWCDGFQEYESDGVMKKSTQMKCDGILGSFFFSSKTNRYIELYKGGYLNEKLIQGGASDDVGVSIGKCSPI